MAITDSITNFPAMVCPMRGELSLWLIVTRHPGELASADRKGPVYSTLTHAGCHSPWTLRAFRTSRHWAKAEATTGKPVRTHASATMQTGVSTERKIGSSRSLVVLAVTRGRGAAACPGATAASA